MKLAGKALLKIRWPKKPYYSRRVDYPPRPNSEFEEEKLCSP
jgi:hypothetical protein